MAKTKSQGPKGALAFSIAKDDKDIEWNYFRTGGPGGQKQNKTSSGARVLHAPSGAVGESREERSQLQNRRRAWERMVNHTKFQIWVNKQLAQGPTPEERVAKDMHPQNLKFEVKQDGKWVEEEVI